MNLASRVQTLADAGSIVISDGTRKLVEGYFALRSMGAVQLKGINEPINVYEVLGLGPLRTRLEKSVGRGLSKFVGRSKEKDNFRRAGGVREVRLRQGGCGRGRAWRRQVAPLSRVQERGGFVLDGS